MTFKLSPASRLRLSLLVLLPGLLMCRPREPVEPTAADVTYRIEPAGPPRPAFTGTVEMLWPPHALPFGFSQKRPGDPVEVTSDYPTPGDAHAVLGKVGFSIRSHQRYDSRHDWKARVRQGDQVRHDAGEELRRRAAAMGANALYPIKNDTYWALYVSKAAPAPGPAPATLLRQIVPAGFSEITRRTLTFDSLAATFEIKAQRGHCYGISLALTENAQRLRSDPPRVGILYKHMGVQSGVLQPLTSTMGVFGEGTEAAKQRASFYTFLCAVADEPLTIELSSRDRPPAGTGEVVVTLHARTQSEAEAHKTICHQCGPVNVECGNVIRSACAPAVKCLAQLNTKPTACAQ